MRPKYSGGSGQRKKIKKTFQRQTQQDLIRAKREGKTQVDFVVLGTKSYMVVFKMTTNSLTVLPLS